MKPNTSQIVLLGGGYVSIWAYRSLVKKLRFEISRGLIQIIVVCPEEFHCFHGWTAESLTCIIQDQNRMSCLSELMPYAQILKGQAEKIDPLANEIYIRKPSGSIQMIHYDHLLIGTGSVDRCNVKGLDKYGFQIKSHEAFLHTREKLIHLVNRASLESKDIAQEVFSITIAGSGFSGVELATNIAEFLKNLIRKYPSLHDLQPRIRLVNSENKLLNVLKPQLHRMRSYTENIMKSYGIEIINNNKIFEVTSEGLFLNDAAFIKCSMVISAIGQSPLILNGTEEMQRDPGNRILLNKYLQVNNHSNIWGGGDACHVENYKSKEVSPPNALWAIKHGEYAGRNIANAISMKRLKSFDYMGLGQCASLGVGKGIGELYGFEFTGWVAWIMRWIFFNYFMPSRKVMFREVMDWMYLFLSGKRKGLRVKQEPTKFITQS